MKRKQWPTIAVKMWKKNAVYVLFAGVIYRGMAQLVSRLGCICVSSVESKPPKKLGVVMHVRKMVRQKC